MPNARDPAVALGIALLVGCSTPPPPGEGAAASSAATDAVSAVPAEITIAYQPTQLCPSPKACRQGDELGWVPTGTTLGVDERHVEELPRSTVHWFRVEYEGRRGWVTEMATDKAPRVRGGKIVRD